MWQEYQLNLYKRTVAGKQKSLMHSDSAGFYGGLNIENFQESFSAVCTYLI